MSAKWFPYSTVKAGSTTLNNSLSLLFERVGVRVRAGVGLAGTWTAKVGCRFCESWLAWSIQVPRGPALGKVSKCGLDLFTVGSLPAVWSEGVLSWEAKCVALGVVEDGEIWAG